jgi:hypothetical protein
VFDVDLVRLRLYSHTGNTTKTHGMLFKSLSDIGCKIFAFCRIHIYRAAEVTETAWKLYIENYTYKALFLKNYGK